MDEIPTIVALHAAQVGVPPMKWRVTETQVVIIFENGQKMTFDRDLPIISVDLSHHKKPNEDPDLEIFKELDAANPPTKSRVTGGKTRRGQASTRKAR